MNDIEKRIEEIVWYLFRKYDVKNSGYELKIQKIVDYCMDDLQKHPDVNDSWLKPRAWKSFQDFALAG